MATKQAFSSGTPPTNHTKSVGWSNDQPIPTRREEGDFGSFGELPKDDNSHRTSTTNAMMANAETTRTKPSATTVRRANTIGILLDSATQSPNINRTLGVVEDKHEDVATKPNRARSLFPPRGSIAHKRKPNDDEQQSRTKRVRRTIQMESNRNEHELVEDVPMDCDGDSYAEEDSFADDESVEDVPMDNDGADVEKEVDDDDSYAEEDSFADDESVVTCDWTKEEEMEDDELGKFSKLLMKFGAEKHARKKATKFAKRMVAVLKKYNHYIDHTSQYAKDLSVEEPTVFACVYLLLKKKGVKGAETTSKTSAKKRAKEGVIKVGSTGNGVRRMGDYVKEGHDPDQYRVAVDFENICKEASDELDIIYEEFVTEMIDDDALHPYQRRFYHMLRHSQGDLLGGIKKQIYLQLIESGIQSELGLGGPREFLMFDRKVCQEIFDLVNDGTDQMLAALSTIRSLVETSDDEMFLHLIGSWVNNIPGHSSQVMTQQCILGTGYDQNRTDAIPFPAIPNAKTAEERYDTSQYTEQHKEDGRQHIIQMIRALLAAAYGILLIDTNKLCFPGNALPNLLVIGFKFRLVLNVLKAEITVYLDPSKKHAVIIIRPMGIASDTRLFIRIEFRTRRQLSAAIVCNSMKALRGEPRLDPNHETRDPICAMLIFQTIQFGFHNIRYVKAAFYRHIVSKPEVNALVENGLGKIEQGAPVPGILRRNIRRIEQGKPPAERPQDRAILARAKAIITQANPGEPESLYWELDAEFQTGSGNEDCRIQSPRWLSLLKKHINSGSTLHVELSAQRENNRKNSGNPNGKGVSDEKIQENTDQLEGIVERHGLKEDGTETGTRFWVAQTANSVKPEPGSKTTCPDYVFPGNYEVVDFMPKDSIGQTRFSTKKTKGKTQRKTSKKWPHLSLYTIPTKSNKNYIVCAVPKGAESGYVLVGIGLKKTFYRNADGEYVPKNK